jgi:serine/threonine protein kinase
MTTEATEEHFEHAPIAVSREPDRWLGSYRLCFELSAGGMASVYLARKRGAAGFEKLVALKRTHPHLARERKFVEMFLDEARIASLIDHANVCSVFDFGETDGLYFIAMEYLVGEPLSRVGHMLTVAGHPTDRAHAVRIARVLADAAEGLHAAHELRDIHGKRLEVVHRDVSPHNLFVTYDGTVKVVDFGIAVARDRLHQTASGQVKGKFPYMSPEQLRGSAVDRRADVFSLGVVGFELLTLRRLFKRPTEAQTITAVLNEEVPPPSTIASGLPPELDAIILRALARDPDDRFPTARELSRELNRFVAGTRIPCGAVEVSEWMGELFPEGRSRKAALADAALEMTRGDRAATTTPRARSRVSPFVYWALAALAAVSVGLGLAFGLSSNAEVAGAAPSQRESIRNEPPPLVAPPVEPSFEERPTIPVERPQVEEPRAVRANVARERSAMTIERPASAIEPAAMDEPRGEGRVAVATSMGWADVYFEGRRIGEAPGVVTLPEGRHVLEVRPYGQAPYRRVGVSVRGGETARVRVEVDDPPR